MICPWVSEDELFQAEGFPSKGVREFLGIYSSEAYSGYCDLEICAVF